MKRCIYCCCEIDETDTVCPICNSDQEQYPKNDFRSKLSFSNIKANEITSENTKAAIIYNLGDEDTKRGYSLFFYMGLLYNYRTELESKNIDNPCNPLLQENLLPFYLKFNAIRLKYLKKITKLTEHALSPNISVFKKCDLWEKVQKNHSDLNNKLYSISMSIRKKYHDKYI